MIYFGTVRPGKTLYIPFDSFAAATGAPTTISGFATTDILIYKDGSTTERASQTGFTLLDTDGIDFDGKTGINGFSVDLSSDATADFYKAGSSYFIVIASITVDGQTVQTVVASFDIGFDGAFLNTSIATLASQTSFTLTTGPAEDDALKGMWAIIFDKASAVQQTWVQILSYTGSTKTVTLAATPAATYTIAAIDNFCVMGVAPLQPATIGRFPLVAADGSLSPNWADVKSPTTALDLSGTTIKTTQVVASVTGAVGSVTGAVGSVTAGVTLAAAAVQAIWDALTTALTTVGSIGKLLVTNIDALISSRTKPADTQARVTLTDTVTTYTGNTPQTGDSYPIISTLKIKKNTALAKFPFLMVLSADHFTPATGLTVVVQRSINGAAFANATNTPATELANGVYYIDLSAADLNGDTIVLKMTSATADQRTIVIATEP